MEVYLQDPGKIPAIGPERGKKPSKNGIGKYKSPHGSYRYVAYVEGQPISVLQVVSRDGKAGTIATAYTLPAHQRQGWATKLLREARKDFKSVSHAEEEHISEEGKAWRDRVHA